MISVYVYSNIIKCKQQQLFVYLGEGHFGVVKRARHVFTGQRVAVKVIDKTKLYNRSDAKEAKEQLVQEVQCMKLVKHTNVVTLYQVGHNLTPQDYNI